MRKQGTNEKAFTGPVTQDSEKALSVLFRAYLHCRRIGFKTIVSPKKNMGYSCLVGPTKIL